MSNENLLDLGFHVGKFIPSKDFPRLTIFEAASESEGYYTPAASVSICGETSLKVLRDFLIAKFPTNLKEGG